jgi:D-3-phosphoglycerate dehydrogenase
LSGSPSVLVTTRFFDERAVEMLRGRGLRVDTGGLAHDAVDATISSEMYAALESASAWILGMAPVSRELLARYPQLQIVARRGVGFDTVDVAAVKDLGRVLTITPGCNEPSVADHALGLMLAVAKRLHESHRRMLAGDKSIVVGTELHAKTVGLLGFGRIGRRVAQRLKGFEVRVLAHDPFLDERFAHELGVERLSLEELLRQSDFVSLHAPLNDGTRHLINVHSIELMKPGAILVNTARGELVDDAALLAALKAGRLGGAGLDVLGSEHDPALEGITCELLALPNVICTQHTGGSSREGLARANLLAAQCVIAALEGSVLPSGCVVADGRTTRSPPSPAS